MKCVVMGVSGCGKSTLGAAIAESLGIGFQDADDLHPAANRAKMAAGQALTDEDRWPWLSAVGFAIAGQPALVMACSALRRSYRDYLRQIAGNDLRFLHLTAPAEVIAARLVNRKGHFMPPALLASQLATLEPLGADEGVTIDVSGAPDTALKMALSALRQGP